MRVKLLWVGLFLGLALVSIVLTRTLQANPVATETAHVKELLSEMKTHCVGRYLFDLPVSFSLSTGTEPLEKDSWIAVINWPDRTYKTYITSKRMYYPAFEQMLKRREQELRETRTDNPLNMPFLKKTWPLSADMKGVVFERNLDVNSNDSVRTLEAYLYSNGVAIKLQKESINDLAPRYQKDRERRGGETNYIPGDLEKLRELFSRIRGRGKDEIPNESGSCIANAFIERRLNDSEQEDITHLFSSENLPGFDVEVNTNNFQCDEEGILERAEDIGEALSGVNARIIHKGSREINLLKASEMLITGPKPNNDYPVYIFDLYANEKRGSNKSPWVNISLSNEGNVNIPPADYNQEELLIFWNAITRTVRMRPVAE
ncbi:hypothetical protein EDF81_4472 [Enterobacter sp. BIGb0383]|uniref:T6SS immunity protein Tli4 family protein n=1 Tax=unclassified Enterobacter TaxID=2608935 RepID=UPI000F47EB3E|nr:MULTISPECIES: T6SS immunity protein Tli4 family protein [unclassified Enterobacter]ROP49460.1 hypothetical protein EDF81_4472 [Enterobacter sp. BIGb0383]ROS00664.1 hypothetical protein EC848_4356 [Enterobacter sp. BIGb0359]